MAGMLGKQLKRRFAVPYACYKLITTRQSLIHQSGWLESMRTGLPYGSSNKPIPWMNYGMVDFLNERLNKTHRLFEFGSGHSTCFYAQRCHSVFSVEHDYDRYQYSMGVIPQNASVTHREKDANGSYCRTINRHSDPFDIVIIDGCDRSHCLTQSAPRLTDDGVLLLGDSDREDYVPAITSLRNQGFRTLRIAGMRPSSTCRHEAMLFYRSQNCLGI